MRKIQFRGKVINSGIWAFGGYYYNKEQDQRIIVMHNDFPVIVHPETVGQYTGLKDKNGKEIYEGDIIKRTVHVPALGDDVNESIEVVEYGTAGFDVRKVGTDDTSYLKEWMFHKMEVIGNIHDNPELLK